MATSNNILSAFAWLSALFVCNMGVTAAATTYYNLYCKFEGHDNDLVCILDALSSHIDNADDYKKGDASFCGEWVVSNAGVKYGAPPESLQCTVNVPCQAVNPKELVVAAYYHRKNKQGNTDKDGEYTFRYEPQSTEEINLTPNMLTEMGYTAMHLGAKPISESKNAAPDNKKYYVGISGGGFRAMSSAMGVIRGLNDKNALSMVDMFSSVSGGTWFLTKFAFDNEFSSKVLGKLPITEVTMDYLENQYYNAVNRMSALTCKSKKCESTISKALTGLLSPGNLVPGAFKGAFGDMILLLKTHRFDWQYFIEDCVFKDVDVFNKTIENAELAKTTSAKVAPNAKFAFNWLQMNQWDVDGKNWFLKLQDETAGKVPQYAKFVGAVYSADGPKNDKVQVRSVGKNLNEVFEACYRDGDKDVCGDFDFSGFTVGQVASASSAAPGPAAFKFWLFNIFQLLRIKVGQLITNSFIGCGGFSLLLKKLVDPGQCDKLVQEEIATLIGCRDSAETLDQTVERWSELTESLAIKTKIQMKDSKETVANHNAFDAGTYDDNGGLATIISEHLSRPDQNDGARILAIASNGLGDHAMEKYFTSDIPGDHEYGRACEPKLADRQTKMLFGMFQGRYMKQFGDVGAKFVLDEQRMCAVRGAAWTYFKGPAPKQYRFEDLSVPRHITYAYKKDAEIIPNDHYYNLEDTHNSKVDILFLILNAPVKTMNMPREGSQPYLATALGMEKAVKALHKLFPNFFPN